MTQFYVKPFLDGHGGCGSVNCPWNGFAEIDWSVFTLNDELVFSPYATYTENLDIQADDILVSGNNATVDGEGLRLAISIAGRQRVVLQNIRSVNHTNSGFKVTGNSEAISFQGVYAENCPSGVNAILQGTEVLNGINVRDSSFSNCAEAGVRVAQSDGGDVFDVVLEGNKARVCSVGIEVYSRFGGAFTAGSIQNVRISRNTLKDCGICGVNVVKNVFPFVIEHNTVLGVTGVAPSSGIHCGGGSLGIGARNGTIRANVVDGVIQHTTDGVGILVDDYTDTVLVEGNVCSNCEEVGVKIHNCNLATVRHNSGVGNGEPGVKTPSATNYVVENNSLS